MRLGFVTCVQLGLSCMHEIYRSGSRLELAITLPDEKSKNKSGRIYLDEFCSNNNIPLLKSSHINNIEVFEQIKHHKIDWLFIIGWSQIAAYHILSAPSHGVIGMHPTLLPIGRGRAAIPWAIIKNLSETGVTAFKLDGGIDTGPVIDQIAIPLSSTTTATELYDRVNQIHIVLTKNIIQNIQRNNISLSKQNDHDASEWPARTPADGLINLNGSVMDAERLIRATTRPYPGAFILSSNLKTIVWRAHVEIERPADPIMYVIFPDGYLILDEWEETKIVD